MKKSTQTLLTFLSAALICAASAWYQVPRTPLYMSGQPRQYPNFEPPQIEKTLVTIHWIKLHAEIEEACDKLPGIKTGTEYLACSTWQKVGPGWVCDIYTRQPKDFNDEYRLRTLGHEIYHCFGANH